MERRAFVAVSLALLAAPLAAEAQPPGKVPRIGYLCALTCIESGQESLLNQESSTTGVTAARFLLLDALSEMGYVEGRNIEIVYRHSDRAAVEPLRLLAGELVRLQVSIIFAAGDTVAQAAKKATQQIPVVVAVSGDPVRLGLVNSLARPGGNVTGVTYLREQLAVKGFQLLREAAPHVSRVAVLLDPTDPVHTSTFKELEVAAQSLGVSLRPIEVLGPTDYQAQFSAMARERIGALVLLASPQHFIHKSRIAYLAVTHRLAAVASFREFAEVGGLIAYGANPRDHIKRAAALIDRILKGARPGDLPMEQPTSFELLINARTAKALDLTIPQSVLLRADEVIQ
jgi:putative ABC transport system substrate-binding protein